MGFLGTALLRYIEFARLACAAGEKIVRARRRADGGFEVQSDENRFDARRGEFRDDFFLFFWHPRAIPVFRERVNVGLLARDPLARVGIAMEVDDSHAIFKCECAAHARKNVPRL